MQNLTEIVTLGYLCHCCHLVTMISKRSFVASLPSWPCCSPSPPPVCIMTPPPPLTGSSSEIPQPQSSMVSGFTALPYACESHVPCASPSLPPTTTFPLHRQAFIALWGQCGYSPGFHSSLREQEVRATGAFEREN